MVSQITIVSQQGQISAHSPLLLLCLEPTILRCSKIWDYWGLNVSNLIAKQGLVLDQQVPIQIPSQPQSVLDDLELVTLSLIRLTESSAMVIKLEKTSHTLV